MAAANYQSCLSFTLKFEGGNSDNPADPGGRTRKGITKNTYDAFRDRWGLARQDVYAMPDSEMETIYRNEYWNAVKGDTLRPGEDLCVFDFAVNSGPAKAKSFWLMTGGASAAVDDVIHQICESRLTFLRSLKTWETFGTGWGNRVAACQATALKMADVLVMPQEAPHVPVHPIPAPHVPVPIPPSQVPPAGLPQILSTSAGRIASGTDTLVAMRDARIAEMISADPEIAAYDAALAAFAKLVAAPAPATPQLPSADPAATTPQRKTTMLGTNWMTSIGGISAILTALGAGLHAFSAGDMNAALSSIPGVIAGIGLLMAKDVNVTGGTVPATPEAAKRVATK